MAYNPQNPNGQATMANSGPVVLASDQTAIPANIADPTTPTNKAAVQVFHNLDNQSLPGTANGLLTGGVAQLLNVGNNLDRQRETGVDSIPAAGVSTGAAQNASPFTVTHAGSITLGAARVFTPSAMAGFTAGAPWSIQVGSIVQLEPTPIGGPVPANQEAVVVTAVTTTTFTATCAKNHTGTFNILGFVYNQSRDGTVADGSAGQGFAAGSTYLFNQVLNSNNGGWERERSAAGELDGASGVGTAVAAEYEFNSGGPGGGSFDRARNLQGKGKGSSTVSGSVAAGVNTLAVAAAVGLTPGEQIILDRGTTNQEAIYLASTYVAGATTLIFASNTANPHTAGATVEWDIFAANGPGLNGFIITGIGIEEEALFDPVTNQYYIERSATQDNIASPNVVIESEGLYSSFAGNGFERARSVSGKLLLGTTGAANAAFNGATALILTAATQTALATAGVTTLNFNLDPSVATNGNGGLSAPLKAGQAILLWNAGTPPTQLEIVYVLATYTGGVAVPITATQITHTGGAVVSQWEGFAPTGPALTGFTTAGMDVDEDAVFDPVSGLFYLERSATQDGMAPQNIVAEAPALWNGTTLDRGYTGSAANLSAFSSKGTEMVTGPGQWTGVSNPAAAAQATVSRAAGAAGVRHVCTSITASIAQTATTAATGTVVLRDGATGVGTILWVGVVGITATTGDKQAITISGLNIIGSAATAMTLEFTAGITGALEAVTVTGYDCQ